MASDDATEDVIVYRNNPNGVNPNVTTSRRNAKSLVDASLLV